MVSNCNEYVEGHFLDQLIVQSVWLITLCCKVWYPCWLWHNIYCDSEIMNVLLVELTAQVDVPWEMTPSLIIWLQPFIQMLTTMRQRYVYVHGHWTFYNCLTGLSWTILQHVHCTICRRVTYSISGGSDSFRPPCHCRTHQKLYLNFNERAHNSGDVICSMLKFLMHLSFAGL
jgi:hypothetical protein